MSSFTTMRAALRARSGAPLMSTTNRLVASRQMHQSSALRMPYKDDMDRESLKPRTHEYTTGGTNGEIADKQDAAYNPNKTDPETEVEAAGAESNDGNALESSPANKDYAEGSRGESDKAEEKTQKTEASRGGDAPKKGRPNEYSWLDREEKPGKDEKPGKKDGSLPTHFPPNSHSR
ncbi:hypothetical protein F5Y00DRAFT_49245 [Daldinia vernicosa]|uniref:uncharacterized protein n=1 Tax=Daldinia vernicosa TaxID=114800 RepID=UPI0020074489|nr:uncharacterized protein F5Y00DRAFT_49245 [Daldinia vernicosa]KAI0849718.1 hypothetical protein F5Y00DRAFT_49245 [Daldinia vernicosa]